MAPPRYARSPQKAPLKDLSVCYPRLRQVAFGMYMPRFNADVQMQTKEHNTMSNTANINNVATISKKPSTKQEIVAANVKL